MTLDICVHEALKRQCELCLRDDEIAELKARVEKLEAALLELVRCVIEGKPLDVAIESARAALEGRSP